MKVVLDTEKNSIEMDTMFELVDDAEIVNLTKFMARCIVSIFRKILKTDSSYMNIGCQLVCISSLNTRMQSMVKDDEFIDVDII